MVAQVKAGDSTTGPFAPDSGSQTIQPKQTIELQGKKARYYLLWITKLAGDQGSVNEVVRGRLDRRRSASYARPVATCPACGRENPDDASFCNACGAALAAAPAPGPEERKLVTVLFADLVGSTALGGSQDPERTRVDARPLLRRDGGRGRARRRDGREVRRRRGHGRVRRARGASRTTPSARCTPRSRCNRRLEALFGDASRCGSGSTPARSSSAAPREGSSFVTGDAVNVAARLEQAAEPGEILVGERTAAIVRGAFEFAARAPVEAKGKPGGVVCRAARARAHADAPARRRRPARGLRRPRHASSSCCYATYAPRGRAAARRSSSRSWATPASARRGSCASSGTGSRRESPEPLRRTGRCLAYGHGITYWPLGEILKEHLGILENDPPELVRERLGGRARSSASRSGSTRRRPAPARRARPAPRRLGRAARASWSPSGRSCCSSRTCTGPRSRCSTCSSGCCATCAARCS